MFAPLSRFLRQKQQEEEARPVLTVETSGLTQEQIATGLEALQLLQIEDYVDVLQRDDCLDFLFAVGLNPTLDALDCKLRQLRLHRNNTFSWGELAHVWKLLLAEEVNEAVILEQAFLFFDRDGNKEISIAELTTTMKELGDLLTEQEIAAFVAIMDKNNDGVIAYEEFLQALRSELPVAANAQHRALGVGPPSLEFAGRSLALKLAVPPAAASASVSAPRQQQLEHGAAASPGRSAAALQEDQQPNA